MNLPQGNPIFIGKFELVAHLFSKLEFVAMYLFVAHLGRFLDLKLKLLFLPLQLPFKFTSELSWQRKRDGIFIAGYF